MNFQKPWPSLGSGYHVRIDVKRERMKKSFCIILKSELPITSGSFI